MQPEGNGNLKSIAHSEIPAVWGSKNDMFQWQDFGNDMFFEPGETGSVKGTETQKLEKNQIVISLISFLFDV